jgi:hypothetical protein
VTKRVPIKVNVANALQWLGTLYRNPADAIKEHISNAIDEHLKAQRAGPACDVCRVVFRLERRAVTIEYAYGMDKKEFVAALQRVADSAKKTVDVTQIGQLGIGIFSFQQIGRKCTFFSKKRQAAETVRVVLREGVDEAEFDTALRREALDRPGIRIVISELKFDPTKPRGPLALERLDRAFSEKFDGYLKKGWLHLEIVSGGRSHRVEPVRIGLPRLAKGSERVPLGAGREVALDLYFDPSGKGAVAVRHSGVVVVEDMKQIPAYGLEDSIYASGYVKGFIDADFLQPLPARTGFDENQDWISFLDRLDKLRPQIEAEVEVQKERTKARALSGIQKRAIQLAREILDLDEFRDLELLGGLRKRRAGLKSKPGAVKPGQAAREQTGTGSRRPGDKKTPSGLRINYEERPFEEGPSKHSRFIGGVVQANILNPDYLQEMQGPDDAKLAYATLVIGKETITYNDRSGASDDLLEKLLAFYFKLKAKIAPAAPVVSKRPRGRPRKVA